MGFGAPLADPSPNAPLASMAPMKAMKAMKAMRAMKASGAAMTKGALAEVLATQMDLKKSVCGKVIGTLAEIGEGEASNQSWEKDDVRKGSRGEGEAGKNRRQGFRRFGPEAEHLKSRPMNVHAAFSPWGCPRSRPKRDRAQRCVSESYVHSPIARFAKK